jgi:hypothetical protein
LENLKGRDYLKTPDIEGDNIRANVEETGR